MDTLKKGLSQATSRGNGRKGSWEKEGGRGKLG